MKNFRILVVMLLLAMVSSATRSWSPKTPRSGHGAAGWQAAEPSALRILSPQPNERVAQDSVTVRYEQDSSSRDSGRATYQLRLDGRDPVRTQESHYRLHGLTPGVHELFIEIVGRDNAPVARTGKHVKFVVAAASAASTVSGGGETILPPSIPQAPSPDLPGGNSSLPLLSVIGFGILVGGVLSALRTRPAHK